MIRICRAARPRSTFPSDRVPRQDSNSIQRIVDARYHARMARRARSIFDELARFPHIARAPLAKVCEGSERADNKLDKDARRPFVKPARSLHFARTARALTGVPMLWSPFSSARKKKGTITWAHLTGLCERGVLSEFPAARASYWLDKSPVNDNMHARPG